MHFDVEYFAFESWWKLCSPSVERVLCCLDRALMKCGFSDFRNVSVRRKRLRKVTRGDEEQRHLFHPQATAKTCFRAGSCFKYSRGGRIGVLEKVEHGVSNLRL